MVVRVRLLTVLNLLSYMFYRYNLGGGGGSKGGGSVGALARCRKTQSCAWARKEEYILTFFLRLVGVSGTRY